MAESKESKQTGVSQTGHQAGPAYNTFWPGLERWADNTFGRTNPVQLPTGFTKWLANNSWWLILIVGVLGLMSLLKMLISYDQTTHFNYAQGIYDYSSANVFVTWYLVPVLLVTTLLYLSAVGKLKEHRKAGWNLVFYASLVSIVNTVLDLVFYGHNLISVSLSLVLSVAIGWTLLFQIRKYFTK